MKPMRFYVNLHVCLKMSLKKLDSSCLVPSNNFKLMVLTQECKSKWFQINDHSDKRYYAEG